MPQSVETFLCTSLFPKLPRRIDWDRALRKASNEEFHRWLMQQGGAHYAANKTRVRQLYKSHQKTAYVPPPPPMRMGMTCGKDGVMRIGLLPAVSGCI